MQQNIREKRGGIFYYDQATFEGLNKPLHGHQSQLKEDLYLEFSKA